MQAEYMCPDCQHPSDRMPVLSALGIVDFFLCRTCQRVSMVSRDAGQIPVSVRVQPTLTTRPQAELG